VCACSANTFTAMILKVMHVLVSQTMAGSPVPQSVLAHPTLCWAASAWRRKFWLDLTHDLFQRDYRGSILPARQVGCLFTPALHDLVSAVCALIPYAVKGHHAASCATTTELSLMPQHHACQRSHAVAACIPSNFTSTSPASLLQRCVQAHQA
jgi:hypothetical protein